MLGFSIFHCNPHDDRPAARIFLVRLRSRPPRQVNYGKADRRVGRGCQRTILSQPRGRRSARANGLRRSQHGVSEATLPGRKPAPCTWLDLWPAVIGDVIGAAHGLGRCPQHPSVGRGGEVRFPAAGKGWRQCEAPRSEARAGRAGEAPSPRLAAVRMPPGRGRGRVIRDSAAQLTHARARPLFVEQ